MVLDSFIKEHRTLQKKTDSYAKMMFELERACRESKQNVSGGTEPSRLFGLD